MEMDQLRSRLMSDYDDESLDYYLSNGKVSLLERLMRNETFQHQFINRVCDFLNTGFKAENVIEKVKSITTRIHDEDLKKIELGGRILCCTFKKSKGGFPN